MSERWYMTIQEGRRVYRCFLKEDFDKEEAISIAQRQMKKKRDDLIVGQAIRVSEGVWKVMVKRGTWWCIGRKENV